MFLQLNQLWTFHTVKKNPKCIYSAPHTHTSITACFHVTKGLFIYSGVRHRSPTHRWNKCLHPLPCQLCSQCETTALDGGHVSIENTGGEGPVTCSVRNDVKKSEQENNDVYDSEVGLKRSVGQLDLKFSQQWSKSTSQRIRWIFNIHSCKCSCRFWRWLYFS